MTRYLGRGWVGSSLDRVKANGAVVRAVAGFDATFSAPKSLSVWWALTGDTRLLAVARRRGHGGVGAFGAVRVDDPDPGAMVGRMHPDSRGLTIASFRQSTSRDDDPQIHTHAVISAKVQTPDGRWYALDARYLKRHQRMLGGLYQSLLRSELTHRFGVAWREIVNGQAEIAGVPTDLLQTFSKRSVEINEALADKVDEFIDREGRTPTRFEHAALEREAAKDTRHKKTGHGVDDLATRWRTEAETVGWTGPAADGGDRGDAAACRWIGRSPGLTVGEIIDEVSTGHSTWGRADVLRAICDRQRPVSQMPAQRWLGVLERAADRVVEHCVDLDPPGTSSRRPVGWAVGVDRTHRTGVDQRGRCSSKRKQIVAWAIDAQLAEPQPVDHRRGRGSGRVAGRRRGRGRGLGRAGVGGRPGGHRQDDDAGPGAGGSAPSHRSAVRVGPDGEGGSGVGAGHRHAPPTPSPSCSTNGPAPISSRAPRIGCRRPRR